LKQRFPLRAKIAPTTTLGIKCLPAAGHFTACSGSKPATCIRARLCRMTGPKPWSHRRTDSRTMILTFAGGDVTRSVCDTDEEVAAALREIDH
jgi:hypothetical protein